MQVLGDLVQMPSPTKLPLPWWHRAPLGLQSGTACYVAWVDNATREVPDLVISVLKPTNWARMVWLGVVMPEGPGVVKQTIDKLTDLNIALAESATLEGGLRHHVTLVCEPPFKGAILPTTDELLKRFSDAHLPVPEIRPFDGRKVLKEERATIKSGWIDRIDWREQVRSLASQSALEGIDLSRAVVSADTSSRLLRYVFPRRGSRTVRVEHEDAPGVLMRIADVLNQRGFNMLSMLLKRGGAAHGNAILVAVCEPPQGGLSYREAFAELKKELDTFGPEFHIKVKISDYINPDSAVTPHEDATVVARVPDDLKSGVQAIKQAVPPGCPAIFLSHRITQDHNAQMNKEEVTAAIRDAGAYPLVVNLTGAASSRQIIHTEVMKHLWAADAGIIFVPALDGQDSLGRNIPHEYGFLEGQGKPAMVLMDKGARDDVDSWTNITGIYKQYFASGHRAAKRDDPESIYTQTNRWVKDLCRKAEVDTDC